MTNRSLRELRDAEIVPNAGGSNAYMVRFGEGDYDTVNKTSKHVLLLEENISMQGEKRVGDVTVSFDLEDDEIVLDKDGQSTTVPDEKQENVLWALYDEDVERMENLYDELYSPTVRIGLADMLMPRFGDGSEVSRVEDGWLIDGEILITWDAENKVTNRDNIHVVRGGSTQIASSGKEARSIDYHIPDDMEVNLTNNVTTELTEVEVRFFTSAGIIAGLSDMPLNDLDDAITEAVAESSVDGFADTRSGLYHGHGMSKHVLSDEPLNVTEEAIDQLWFHSYDHAGIHELGARRQEFKNAPIQVFKDVSNDDEERCETVDDTIEQAPIPASVRHQLDEQYSE